MTKLINHINKIEDDINYIIDMPKSNREIYCKRLHTITEPQRKDCVNCPYFNGLAGGFGIECMWEDVSYPDEPIDVIVPHSERFDEMMRVSKMIDFGVLTKG